AFGRLYEQWSVPVRAGQCALGSVKTNIGHLELAAGVAGVIKVLLQMRHRTLAKSLHCERINPLIELEGSPFRIAQESEPWERWDGQPRRAGVSSFGFGGVNAHVVLEEYEEVQEERGAGLEITVERPALVVLSAKSLPRLRERAQQLLDHLDSGVCGEE